MSAVAGAAEVPQRRSSARSREPPSDLLDAVPPGQGGDRGRLRDIALLVLAALAGVISSIVGHPQNSVYLDMTDDFGIPKGPSTSFWFGADASGRDLFVRVLTAPAPRCSWPSWRPASR